MPNSFWLVTCSILYLRTSKFRHFSEFTLVRSFCLLPISMHLVLSIPTTMLLAQHQLLTVSDMIWSSHSTLLMSMPWAEPVASSAERFMTQSLNFALSLGQGHELLYLSSEAIRSLLRRVGTLSLKTLTVGIGVGDYQYQ